MMKKSISYIMLFFCLSFMSCNKWLDVPSKEEVIDYEMFKTEQGFMAVSYTHLTLPTT